MTRRGRLRRPILTGIAIIVGALLMVQLVPIVFSHNGVNH